MQNPHKLHLHLRLYTSLPPRRFMFSLSSRVSVPLEGGIMSFLASKLNCAFVTFAFLLAIHMAVGFVNDEDLFGEIIPDQLNETCLTECSQRAATLQANLSMKYPQHEEEISSFPLSAGFLEDFCNVHRDEHHCRSTCGNMSSVDPRLKQIVWALPHLMCDEEYERLLAKHSCLLEAKKLANATCVTECQNREGANAMIKACRRYPCVFECEKPTLEQKCTAESTNLVKRIRQHGWPVGCDGMQNST